MIRHPLLSGLARVRHGFFTRQGGVSDGIYESRNCGFGSGDDRDRVAENRRRILGALTADSADLITVHQVHSADVAVIEQPFAPQDAPRADAMVTDRPGLALGVLTADCAPILFADAAAGVVGCAHAGWKGAIAGVAETTVAAMARLGADRGRITAVIGPAIAQASYEVGPEFQARFLDHASANDRFFQPSSRPGHFLFDLAGYVAARLGEQGLGAVAVLAHDTYRQEALFFSYRRSCHRDEPDYGRQVSAIALAED